jgi:hypothetical protein
MISKYCCCSWLLKNHALHVFVFLQVEVVTTYVHCISKLLHHTQVDNKPLIRWQITSTTLLISNYFVIFHPFHFSKVDVFML